LLLNNNRLSDASSSIYLNEIYEELISLMGMGYVVSLDLHADDAVSKKFAEGYETGFLYLQGIWKKLATMAQVLDPEKVALELLNEPNIGQEDWMRAAGGLIDTIRQIAPQHTIIVGPSGPQRHETLSGMQPFADPNIVYAIHYYDPFLFTHQGATWGRITDPLRVMKGLPFPASLKDARIVKILADLDRSEQSEAATAIRNSLGRDWNEDVLREAFDIMAGWAKTHSRPVIVNEFGVLDFVVDRQSRLNWLSTVNRLARQRCLGWTHWDFQQGFGLIDRKTRLPDAGIMRALRDVD
jgi:endoglucanase